MLPMSTSTQMPVSYLELASPMPGSVSTAATTSATVTSVGTLIENVGEVTDNALHLNSNLLATAAGGNGEYT